MRKIIVSASLILIINIAHSQSTTVQLSTFTSKFNVITSAVPFLSISPDARSGGLGDAGVSIAPDANSVYWNSAKLAFAEKKSAMCLSSAPWLRTLVPDVWLHYVSGYKKIDNRSAWGGSLRYFSLGSIQFTDQNNNSLGNFNPSEFALDGCYSRKLSEFFSVGVNLRFILSNLAGRVPLPGGGQSQSGIGGAGDISLYYKKPMKYQGKNGWWAWGMNIANIGNKITYTSTTNRDFIPTNIKTGFTGSLDIDDYNSIALTTEIQKLMIPSPPRHDDPTDASKITSGMDNKVSVAQGMIQSFYDAPGGGKEEFREIIYQFAAEYWYAKQFAFRTGFFHESPYKGNRRYLTFGMGLRYNVFGLDFAYLVPFQQRNPLENTLRFSLHFNFGANAGTGITAPPDKK